MGQLKTPETGAKTKGDTLENGMVQISAKDALCEKHVLSARRPQRSICKRLALDAKSNATVLADR